MRTRVDSQTFHLVICYMLRDIIIFVRLHNSTIGPDHELIFQYQLNECTNKKKNGEKQMTSMLVYRKPVQRYVSIRQTVKIGLKINRLGA